MATKKTLATKAALGLTSIATSTLLGADVIAMARQGGNEIRLYNEPLAYEIVKDGVVVLPKTEIGLVLDNGTVKCDNPTVSSSTRIEEIETPIYKKAKIVSPCNISTANFGDFSVVLAAMKDGVAWRFTLNGPSTVIHERADITLSENARCWFNRLSKPRHFGEEETVPESANAKELPGDRQIYLPFVYSTLGKTVAVAEADLYDYPALYFNAQGNKLASVFSKYPKSVKNDGADEDRRGRRLRVKESEDFIAKDVATLPWRVFILADSPAKLCEADIIYALSRPADKEADFSWVKPGKVAWDWWSDFDNLGEEKGCTTDGYKRFIDFAAKNNVEYVILDEGWSEKLDIWRYSPRVDVDEVIRYANERGVGIILWMAWAQTYGEEEKVAAHFAKLGAKGFKVDFIDRGDADAATFMERFAAACVRHKMLVDYHGVYRPTGMQRQFPNILNYEGIHGLEQMKWAKADKDMCANDVGAFFLRGSAGPMDYTPGAMDNYKIGAYSGDWRNPGSVGTRAHQMALTALYEAPLGMLCDSPAKYERNMECFKFMAAVPNVWSDTRGLGGDPESYAAVARKARDGSWWIAGITNSSERDIELYLGFLGDLSAKAEWKMEIFCDAPDADENPAAYIHETQTVGPEEKMHIHLAKGGGFLAHLTK